MKIVLSHLFATLTVFISSQLLAADAARPNIVFILVDDLGKEWVSCFGADDIQTPNADRLARTGMQFDNFYVMPQCTPTRLTLLTGQYPFRHGWVNHWDVPRWGGGCHYDWNRNPCLARVMKNAGYATAVAGKWQINDFRVQPNAMTEMGFDEFCMWTGGEGGNSASDERYWDPHIHTKEGSRTLHGAFGPDVYTNFLLNFIEQKKDEPFFVYFPMALTHSPLVATPAPLAAWQRPYPSPTTAINYPYGAFAYRRQTAFAPGFATGSYGSIPYATATPQFNYPQYSTAAVQPAYSYPTTTYPMLQSNIPVTAAMPGNSWQPKSQGDLWGDHESPVITAPQPSTAMVPVVPNSFGGAMPVLRTSLTNPAYRRTAQKYPNSVW